MVLRFHDFYFMVFISREYLGVEVSFRYDEWHGDIGGISSPLAGSSYAAAERLCRCPRRYSRRWRSLRVRR